MDTREIRRTNLRFLAEKYGGQRALAEAANLMPNQLNHIIGPNPIRNLGEQLARKIEISLGLTKGYLDTLHIQKSASFISTSDLIPLVSFNTDDLLDGSFNIEFIKDGLIAKQWATDNNLDPEGLIQYVMPDENMNPNILKNDNLIIDTKRKNIINSSVYLIIHNGILSVKRFFFMLGSEVKISNDNLDKTLFPDIITSQDKLFHIQIVGQIVAIQRNLPF